MTAKFDLGLVLATPGAVGALELSGVTAKQFLDRHSAGDWGDVCEEDKELNDAALLDGTRLVSSYDLPNLKREKVLIITEADRSVTTLLLGSEY